MHYFIKPEKVGLVSIERLGVSASGLRHTFAKDDNIPRATRIVDEIFQNSIRKFTGRKIGAFDKFNPIHAEIMRPIMHEDSRMAEVFRILELEYTDVGKLYLPWWNVEGGREVSCSREGNDFIVALGSRHSYQTQLMRQGVDIQGMNAVSVASIVHTSDNNLVVGLRGGLNFQNTYYFSAGALNLTEQLKNGTATIYSTYLRTELRNEYGMDSEMSHATLISRVECHGTDRDVSYVFAIKTRATFEEIRRIHEANPNQDKHEHRRLEAVNATLGAVMDFVGRYYRGAASNDNARNDRDIVLLPQGAAPLIEYVGGDVSIMERLAR